ncbi:MAG: hypothetical protein ABIR70_13105 [Bryobacteraceae bacterium]
MTPEMHAAAPEPRRSKILRYCFALFTFEVGLFLVIFPWTDTWLFNYFQDYNALFRDIWEDPYFRGGISGLGFVNLYLATSEFLRTLRA